MDPVLVLLVSTLRIDPKLAVVFQKSSGESLVWRCFPVRFPKRKAFLIIAKRMQDRPKGQMWDAGGGSFGRSECLCLVNFGVYGPTPHSGHFFSKACGCFKTVLLLRLNLPKWNRFGFTTSQKDIWCFSWSFWVPFDFWLVLTSPKKPMEKTPGWTVDASRRDCLLERFCDSQTSLLSWQMLHPDSCPGFNFPKVRRRAEIMPFQGRITYPIPTLALLRRWFSPKKWDMFLRPLGG